MIIRFKQHLIVNGHNYVAGDVADLHDDHARKLIHAGAVEAHTPEEKRYAAISPRTRKAVKEA